MRKLIAITVDNRGEQSPMSCTVTIKRTACHIA